MSSDSSIIKVWKGDKILTLLKEDSIWWKYFVPYFFSMGGELASMTFKMWLETETFVPEQASEITCKISKSSKMASRMQTRTIDEFHTIWNFMLFCACAQWIPQNYLWCDTSWPLGDQHDSPTVSVHIPDQCLYGLQDVSTFPEASCAWKWCFSWAMQYLVTNIFTNTQSWHKLHSLMRTLYSHKFAVFSSLFGSCNVTNCKIRCQMVKRITF